MLYTIIYDETSEIIMATSQTGYGKISAIEAEVPDGYYVKSVDPETNEPVLEPVPKTDEQLRIEALEQQMNALIGVNESEVTE